MEVKVRDLNINYDEYSPDKPIDRLVLILHGWGCNCGIYKGIAQTCADKYRVIVPDLPGHGKSEEPKDDWCADDFADFVLEFISELQKREAVRLGNIDKNDKGDNGQGNFENATVKELILIGHSNGGRIIIKLLAEKQLPFDVKKVVLIDSAGIRNPLPFKARVKQRFYKLGKSFLNLRLIKKLDPNGLDRWGSRFGSSDYKAASPVMRRTMVRLINEDQRDKLKLIKAETLLIWGDKDTATPLSDAKLMEKEIRGSGLVVVEGAGHFSFAERPELVQRVLRSYLEITN